MLFRFALSWFPQLINQFPILRPVFTVTEPYLKIFRSQIPPIAGFDISAIPALFVLDIFGQTAAAIGCDDEYIQNNQEQKMVSNKDTKKNYEKKLYERIFVFGNFFGLVPKGFEKYSQ
jgi:hypothetical protein